MATQVQEICFAFQELALRAGWEATLEEEKGREEEEEEADECAGLEREQRRFWSSFGILL